MTNSRDIKQFFLQGWGLSVGLALALYFALQAFKGDYSVHSLKALNSQAEQLTLLKKTTEDERNLLEQRVARMGQDGLDADLLEENVRKKLGFAHPDEIIIYTNLR